MIRRITALVVMSSMLTSCMGWKRHDLAVDRLLEQEQPELIQVRLASGIVTVLKDPILRGDSLIGLASGRRVAVPVADVRAVSVQRLHAGKTLGLVAGIGLTAILVASLSQNDPPPPPPPRGDDLVSCPLIYSWDGTDWRLDSGTFGGAITRAAARTDVDNLVYALPEDGVLRLKLANELSETDYVDALTVIAVDHDPGFSVAPNPFGELYTIGDLRIPLTARDFRGRGAIERIAYADGWNWESNPTGRDPRRLEDVRDGLELTFTRPQGAGEARLVLDGNGTPWASYLMARFVRAHGSATQAWYDSLDSDPGKMRELGTTLIREAFLGVSVLEGDLWAEQGFFWEAGPEVVKRQVLNLDLSRVVGDTVKIRLESAPSFWLIDHVAMDYSPRQSLATRELRATLARDVAGRDVRSLLAAANQDYVVLESGDWVELEFQVPPIPSGQARSYLVRSTGWYRIHSDNSGEPDVGLLRAATAEPRGISRTAVALLNDALRKMEASAL